MVLNSQTLFDFHVNFVHNAHLRLFTTKIAKDEFSLKLNFVEKWWCILMFS